MPTINGLAVGRSRLDGRGALHLSGRCQFYLYDHFRDVLDVLNIVPGDNLDLPTAKTFIITDEWQGRFDGIVQSNRHLSIYR